MSNARFSEYTTSGAFTLSLTRNQASLLTMLEGGSESVFSSHLGALNRKGLVETIQAPTHDRPDAVEVRLTMAGLLTAGLVREAGLSNGAPDPLADELAALRAEIVVRRREAADARRDARSALARKAELAMDLENERCRARHERLKMRIFPRDPQPHLTDQELSARVSEPGD